MVVAPPPIARALLFPKSGPLYLLTGGAETNPARGGTGTGTISYSSSDTDIATVDSAGLVSAVSLGSATITANKTGDSQYAAASANYTLNIAPPSIAMTAWVGSADTQVGFPASADGLEFYRTTQEDCDLVSYASCANGQLDFLNSMIVTDTAATLSQAGFYTLQHGIHQAALTVSSNHFSARINHPGSEPQW